MSDNLSILNQMVKNYCSMGFKKICNENYTLSIWFKILRLLDIQIDVLYQHLQKAFTISKIFLASKLVSIFLIKTIDAAKQSNINLRSDLIII